MVRLLRPLGFDFFKAAWDYFGGVFPIVIFDNMNLIGLFRFQWGESDPILGGRMGLGQVTPPA